MKYLIQKCEGEVVYDFAFTLKECIKFQNWLHRSDDYMKIRYLNTTGTSDEVINFKPLHRNYTPVGSVEFVSQHLKFFHNIDIKPLNVPLSLFSFAGRRIYNGNHSTLFGRKFVKSGDKIKHPLNGIHEQNLISELPEGRYQFSDEITIDSEWRAFVYKCKLIDLRCYCGEFTKFPNVETIKSMIEVYQDAPIMYTLDVGVNDEGTFVIEVHNFFSCGLYGFNLSNLPIMLSNAYNEIIRKNKTYEN